MIRARFKVFSEDARPVNWPIKHPYWITGTLIDGEMNTIGATIVAYADDLEELLRNWPDAEDIDGEERSEYTFTDRFPKPEWVK